MNTKRYRIYKTGGQQGRVMNPTAMWFAQMGAQQPSQEEMMMMQQSQGQAPMQGMPSQEEMAMMQQAQQQPSVGEEELMRIMQALQEGMDSENGPQDVIFQMLKGEVPPEVIVEALVRIGAPPKDAERLVMATIEQMQGEAPQMSEEEMMAQAAGAQGENPNQEALAMGKNGYIKKRLKEAQAGMSMDEESDVGSATNFAANMQPSKVAILNYNQQNQLKNAAANEFDNMQMAQDQMQAGENLEQARFGRGRARRRMRRLNNAISDIYSGIAMPPGVAPMMMPGMPTMGPNVMDVKADFGFFGGLRGLDVHTEYANQMPTNFGQSVFMNGMYNPYAMMNSGNFMYDIIYPGTKENPNDNVTGNDANKITIINDTDDGSGSRGGLGDDGTGPKPSPNPTANTEPEGGCPEGYKWDPNEIAPNNLPGVCVQVDKVNVNCVGGQKYNDLTGSCECPPDKPLFNSATQQCEARTSSSKDVEGGDWTVPLLTAFGTGAVIYANRKKIAKWLVDRGQPVTKQTVNEAIKEISEKNLKGYFSNIPSGKELTPLIGKDGQLVASFYDDIKTVPGPEDLRALPGSKPIVKDPLDKSISNYDDLDPTKKGDLEIKKKEIIDPKGGSKPKGSKGQMSLDFGADKPYSKGTKLPDFTVQPEGRKEFLKEVKALRSQGLQATEVFYRKYKIPLPKPPKGSTKISKKYLIDNLFKIAKKAVKRRMYGGEISEDDMINGLYDMIYGSQSTSNLAKFTGGGQEIDYFSEGGYYEDGGTNDFEMLSTPAYKNVFDPYMQDSQSNNQIRYYIRTLMSMPPKFQVVGTDGKTYGTFNNREAAEQMIISFGGDPNYNPDPSFTKGFGFGNEGTPIPLPHPTFIGEPTLNPTPRTKLSSNVFKDGGALREGQELYMPAEKIAQFMAAGGVVEFLD